MPTENENIWQRILTADLNFDTITTAHISRLRDMAWTNGDQEIVNTCTVALIVGDRRHDERRSARATCVELINAARNMRCKTPIGWTP